MVTSHAKILGWLSIRQPTRLNKSPRTTAHAGGMAGFGADRRAGGC